MPRILLVDDDIAEISAVKRLVLRGGHQLSVATNSSDALAFISRSPPDLVVLALACENGDGRALARQLARDPERGIPLVLLGEGEAEGGGAARAVPRPMDPAALEDALRAALEQAGPRRKPPAEADAGPVDRACEAVAVSSPRSWPQGARPGGDERQSVAEALLARAQELRTVEPQVCEDPLPPRERENGKVPSPVTWFDTDASAVEAVAQPLDASAFETPEMARLAEATRRAQEERETAQDAVRRAQVEREAAQEAARRALEEAEARRVSVAEAARRRVLAMAKERAASAARPSAPEVPEALAPELSEGTLAAVSMPRLLALAARGCATGRLDVATEFPRALWLEQGRVVGARSTAPGERTEDVALRLGLITRDQHRRVSPDTAGLASRRVGALLLERGFLKSSELALLARRRAEEIAFALFPGEARYRFEAGARVPTDERLALERGTPALAVEGVRRRWGAPRLDAVLGGAGTLLAPASRAAPAAELRLSAEERRVWELADGLRTLDEILAGSPLDPLSSRQVLAALVEVGVLEVKILAPPGAAEPSPGSIDLARIDEKLDQVRRADYFVILGLGRACTPYEIKEAAERLLSELAAERFGALPDDGLPAKLEEIRQVLEEARDILSDDVLRAEYLAGLGD